MTSSLLDNYVISKRPGGNNNTRQANQENMKPIEILKSYLAVHFAFIRVLTNAFFFNNDIIIRACGSPDSKISLYNLRIIEVKTTPVPN